MFTVLMAGPVIRTERLRLALNRLLDEVETTFGETVDLDGGLYWQLDPRDAFALAEAPDTLTADLVDDCESVEEMLGRGDSEVILWHDLAHAVGVLARIAALDLPDA